MARSRRRMANSVVILDFETTGLSPDQGDRAIEIGAVQLKNGVIKNRFQSLMKPGMRISSFIEDYTGITNEMLDAAPSNRQVMNEFADFIGDQDLVAHNASFDRRFMDAEMKRIRRRYTGEFLCSLLVARRLYQDAPNHRLGTLVEYKKIPNTGTFHRALADAEMTAHLWVGFLQEIEAIYGVKKIPVKLMQELSKRPKNVTHEFLKKSGDNTSPGIK
jgi:DNA polymerase-3 subunit epsilon